MSANTLIRNPLWATLLAALVAAMVSYLVFVPNSEAAPAADGKYYPYIINGEPVPNGKYPFMVALIDKTREPSSINPYKYFCAGTLIDKDSVLTAGHCFFRPPNYKELFDPQQLRVTVGRTVLSSNQGQVRRVKRLSAHPGFKELPLDPNDPYFVDERYDAGVIELRRPVKGIKPIELATSKQNYLERPGRNATVAGWGLQLAYQPGADYPPKSRIQNHMRDAQVPLVSDSRAGQIYTDYLPPIMIAAGGKGKDTCLGDSGGPLFVRTSGHDDNGRNGDDDNGGKYTQIGITSFTSGCGYGIPDVYTEVNAQPIASFIERTADNGDGDNGNGDNGDDK
jgi:secreted trypsin-like serine protease